MAIACVLCLVAKHHSNAELINMTLPEYQCPDVVIIVKAPQLAHFAMVSLLAG
jgi:hypothetical protein